MITSVSHIALFVPDLQEAEDFYQHLFDMELVGRESEGAGGLWYTLPFDKGWDDARSAGLELGMTALRKGGLVLALFRAKKPSGQVYVIGLSAAGEDIRAIYERLSPRLAIQEFRPDYLEFIDPYQITWQIAIQPVFRTAGDFADRWLDV